MPLHRSIARSLALLLSSAFLGPVGCAEPSELDGPCLAGARICYGTVVMLCDPQAGRFKNERVCEGETVCLSGACVPRGFVDAWGSDTAPDAEPEFIGALDSVSTDGSLEAGGEVSDAAEDLPTTADEGSTGDLDAADWNDFEEVAVPDASDAYDMSEAQDAADVDADTVDGAEVDAATDTDAGILEVDATPDVTVDAGGELDGGGDDVPSSDADAGPADPFDPGLILYEPIPNFVVTGDLRRVAWDVSGDFALATGPSGALIRLETTPSAFTLLGSVPGLTNDVVATGPGTFLVAGEADGAGVLWEVSVDGDSLTIDDTIAVPFGLPVSVKRHPVDERVAVAAHSSNSIAYLYIYDPVDGLGTTKAFNASAGISDAMWAPPSMFGGSDALVTSHGINGADSKTWIMNVADNVVANGWSPGFGNAGAARWRPGGGYGVVAGWSSNKLYVFDGTWTLGTLPLPTGASPSAVAWRDDGRRGLVVGRVVGSPAYASVVEIRAGADPDSPYNDGILVNQSIQAFDGPPWNGNAGSQYLLDVAWRPNTVCDEGVIVGSDNSSSVFNPTFGLAIRFWDSDDPACP